MPYIFFRQPISSRLNQTANFFFAALLFFCSAFVVPSSAFAENNVGLAYLAMQHPKWPCEQSLKIKHNNAPKRIAFLWNTFGVNLTCPETFIKSTGRRSLQIYLLNEVCLRNKNCGPYEILSGLTPQRYQKLLEDNDSTLLAKLTENFTPVRAFIDKLPNDVTCYIAPGLESDLSKSAAKTLVEHVRLQFPKCTMVWSSGPRGVTTAPEGTILELHGSRADPAAQCVASLDGEDISFAVRRSAFYNQLSEKDLPAYLKKNAHCDVNYLWILEFNGNCQGAQQFVDPRNRTCWPSADLFKEFANYL